MGDFSIWYWIVVLFVLLLPIPFVLMQPPPGPNRFGAVPPPRSFQDAISSFFRNYVTFSGRASRSEFWYAILMVWLGSLIAQLIDGSGAVSSLWGLATLLPTLAVASRRLHDINRSGWFQLLSCLFPVGLIATIIWYCRQSDADPRA